MKKLIIIFAIVLSFACKPGDLPFTQSKWDSEANDALNRIIGIGNENTNFQHFYTTPGGIKVKSVVPVPDNFLTAADEGTQEQIDRLSRLAPEWVNGKRLTDYTILIVVPNSTYTPEGVPSPPCQNRFTEPGSPCIYVQGTQAAGTIIGYDDRYQELDIRPAIVVPHQVAQDWRFRDYFKASVHNEGEHVRSWLNKTNNPTGMFYHFQGANDSHPFQFGDVKGLKGATVSYCLPQ